jgi:ferrous iron transport protein B
MDKEKVHRASHAMAYTRKRALVDYGLEAENEIATLQAHIEAHPTLVERYNSRWLAIKLLEEDRDILAKLQALQNAGHDTDHLLHEAEQSVAHLREIYGDDADTLIADRRYGWIHGLMKEVVHRTRPDRLTRSDKIDKIATHRLVGVPIFLAMMWAVFKITTDIVNPYVEWISSIIDGPLTNWASALLGVLGLGGTWVERLFLDGVIAGVGGILVFVPVLIALYTALAILEDSGYMARAAFVMDQLMHVLGLHGKSFIPMIVGFGCTVPALYATRTLDSQRDRVLTGLLVPFMSCSARLPVYVFFATIFFPANSGIVVFWLYVIGIVAAILLGLLLKDTLFKQEEASHFVMELPPYRMPMLKAIWFHTWERTSAFVRKAGTLILATSVFFWFLLALPARATPASPLAGTERGKPTLAEVDVDQSAFALVSRRIAPLFTPAGFGNWRASGALVTGIVAKEVVVSTLAQVYDVESSPPSEDSASHTTFFEDIGQILVGFIEATWNTIKSIPLIVGINLLEEEQIERSTELQRLIRQDFETTSGGHGALAALAYTIFVLLYTPCVAALAAEWQELGPKWAITTALGQLGLAWIAAVLVFQGGKLLGLG